MASRKGATAFDRLAFMPHERDRRGCLLAPLLGQLVLLANPQPGAMRRWMGAIRSFVGSTRWFMGCAWFFAAFGLLRSRREGQPAWLVLAPVVYLNLLLAALLSLGRYSVPVLPCLLVLSAAGLDSVVAQGLAPEASVKGPALFAAWGARGM